MAPSVLFCNRCGEENPIGSRFCEVCGDPFEQPTCACGAELVPKARFCHMCGTPVAPAVAPAAPAPVERAPDLAGSLRALHHDLLATHARAAQALDEARRLQALVAESYARATTQREAALTAQRAGDTATAQAALASQIEAERDAAEHRARWELAEAACAPLRDELSQQHARFLAATDTALNDLCASSQWTDGLELFSSLARAEVSRSRKGRLLYATGILARDGLGDLALARQSFQEALDADPKNHDARGGLESLG